MNGDAPAYGRCPQGSENNHFRLQGRNLRWRSRAEIATVGREHTQRQVSLGVICVVDDSIEHERQRLVAIRTCKHVIDCHAAGFDHTLIQLRQRQVNDESRLTGGVYSWLPVRKSDRYYSRVNMTCLRRRDSSASCCEQGTQSADAGNRNERTAPCVHANLHVLITECVLRRSGE